MKGRLKKRFAERLREQEQGGLEREKRRDDGEHERPNLWRTILFIFSSN